MNSLEAVTTFFGWTAAINIALLFASTIMIMLARDAIGRIHGKMFGLDPAKLSSAYFQFIAQFKMAVIVFSLTPYIALKLMV